MSAFNMIRSSIHVIYSTWEKPTKSLSRHTHNLPSKMPIFLTVSHEASDLLASLALPSLTSRIHRLQRNRNDQ